MPEAANNDAELVSGTLAGNRDAFGQIVTRYQSLICSLAYSATGSLGQSEDLAQETFITAWKHLGHLRERHKFRAWLCGIARNRINNFLRREGREPIRAAEPLEHAPDAPAPEPLPGEQTISNEEQAILWRALERIPEIYREPLVLFYREHQSVEAVAQNLELTEDAVKQRLSRGRKLLHEQVLAFVEGALAKTSPGKAFTLGVLASLPVTLTMSAKAATLGAAAAKGGLAAKATATAGLSGAILGPQLGIVGPWIQYRMFLEAAKTARERDFIKRYYRKLLLSILVFAIVFFALCLLENKIFPAHPVLYVAALLDLVFGYVAILIRMAMWSNSMFKQFRAEQAALANAAPAKPAWEYRSRFELLGLPFIHIRLNDVSRGTRAPVKAWIAAGNCAIGVLFAFGGVAIAPVSIGGVAIGLMPWGGMAVGGFALGGFALGVWAFGGFAIGWQTFGGCAIALNAAQGGLAIARDFALGGGAHAAQANNPIAAQFIKDSFFFRNMEILSRHIAWMNLLWLVPLIGWWRLLAKRAKRN
jgi:RNA polymerase sigma factor (sigma-70 family)